jgi:translation initiation factor 3 subunit L
VVDVTNYLQALVDKSGIVAELKADGGQALKESEGYGPHSNVLRMLGYFSLVGLQRVHSLIGDYDSGLKALFPIVLQNPSVLYSTKIPGCNITAHYYSAFDYIMLKRYNDASKILNSVLTYVARVKSFLRDSSQYDQILKKNEQMYALLAIVVALAPAAQRNLDEQVATMLREK